ncbi:pyridoxamine 5'-phosphate oxidase family protein [Halobacteriales archaeon Cl-PHB]
MPTYSGPWDADRVAEFLEETVVPVRLACSTPSDRLWLLSLWFTYRERALWCATPRSASVVEFVESDGHVAFEVSTNDVPYRGVRGNGTATVEPDGDPLLRDLLDRYLGGTDSPLARRLLGRDRDEVAIRIDPERVASWDFTDRMEA